MSEWQDISTAPQDGTIILIWEAGSKWPEAAFYEQYDPDVSDEVGEVGYWRFADDVLADIADPIDPSCVAGWMPLPPAPLPTEGE